MRYPSLEVRGVTVAQFPNPPLWIALMAALISRLASEGAWLYDGARSVFYVALTVWAWEEATRGVNRFRRALGVAAIAYIVFTLARVM